jgi:sugar/nucleoside kinase (ribokinase family)
VLKTKVLSVGNTCADLVMRHTTSLPKWGEERFFEASEERLGGQGANVAIAVARLGGAAFLLSSVGDDDRGKRLRSELEMVAGLDCSMLRVERSQTGFTVAAVREGGERFFLTYQGHQEMFTLEGAEKALAILGKRDVVHVSGYFQMPRAAASLPRFLSRARAKGAMVSFDPGWSSRGLARAEAESFWQVMELVDWYFPNEDELKALTGRASLAAASTVVGNRLSGHMVVKRGKLGCAVYEGGRMIAESPAFRVAVVDSVGAGDAFDAAFLLGVGEAYSVNSCARMGNAGAALAISTSGGPTKRFPSLSRMVKLAGRVS